MSTDAVERLRIQELQYEFPYHYIPHFSRDGVPLRVRHLRWGFEYLCYQTHIKALVESLGPKSVVEVGCGDGYLIGSLPASMRRMGVDLSEQAIRFARAFHPDVDFQAVDAASISARFDAVLAIEVMEHVPEFGISGFVRTLAELVGPGGVLVVSVPSDVVPVHAKHHRHYSEALLKSQVLENAPSLQLERIDHVYDPPRWLELFAKLTCNRFVAFEVPALNAVLWKYIWGRVRHAQPRRGRHIVAVFRRRA
jgi:2-polyprenyl-3-methyl-5-hydroxy-6-metoxy-1,4-benzoquinol methylase